MNKRYVMIFTAICGSIFSLLADMPRDYYPNSLEGKNGAELKTELHNLLKNHTRLPYGSRDYNQIACTWTVFKKSDVRPNGKVWDMYSNNSYNFSNGAGATKGMNIEHSVPKSWWGDAYDETATPLTRFKYDGSYDLHHLTPSDADANMAKSNYPLGVVDSPSFDNGVTKVGTGQANGRSTNLFEPADEYKGDFARMYLYFVTCYQDYSWKSSALSIFAQNSYPTLNAYGQSLLLKWHRQDPVSQKEIDRNNAVYSFQGNRNPFIDYPNMVEYIWGDSTNYEFSFSGQSTSAPSISISNDKIEFGYIRTETSKDKEIYIKGKNLTTDITAKLLNNDSGDFSLGMSNLPAHELNTTGINLAITFSPRSIGTRNVTLRLSSDELSAPVDITISGTVLLSDASYLRIIDIKSTYKKSDEPVRLMLNMNLDTQWTVDGKPATHLTPSELSAGLHTIQFTTTYGTGKMRVQIIE
ncbi:endonuclease I family protein [Barnesiella intestinihominis]|uniref:endonuclease I family protein n=1 Tax=Barnesiella intestinihominis TaxID=487174 RepID=UPI0039708B5F